MQRCPAFSYGSNDSDDDDWRDDTVLGQSVTSPLESHEDTPDRQPDDCWMLPSNSTEVEVLGPRCIRLAEIQKQTEAYVVFNAGKHQVDIWGDRQCIDRAKQFLDIIGNQINERKHPARRTKKWEKAERELTEKEKRRNEKRQQRILEGKSFQGLPTTPQPYTAIFPLPDESIPLAKILGDKEAYMNEIRATCKSHVWFDDDCRAFRVAGQDEDLVRETAARLRQLYLRIRRFTSQSMPRSAVIRLLYQPTKNIGARFTKLPKDFVPCDLYVPDNFLDKYRCLEPLAGGTIPKQFFLNANSKNTTNSSLEQSMSLIDLHEDHGNASRVDQGNSLYNIPERLRTLNIENAKRMETALDEGLESLRLVDWEITMEVAFGQIYLLDYPAREAFYTFPSEDLAFTYFPNSKFNSKLAPCIGTSYDHVKELLLYLSHQAEEYTDSPRTSYVIQALQNPTLPEQPPKGLHPRSREAIAAAEAAKIANANAPTWKSVLTINRFTLEGHVGLWNCVTDSETLVSINCANLEGDYSWETRLNYARRLPSDLNTPQGQFVEHMRLSNEDRLIIAAVPGYRPHIIKQLTKWVYAWGKYTIEVEKEEMWDMTNMEDALAQASGLPLDLSSHTPHRVNFHVSMIRETWRDRFAENVQLQIGQAPTWTTRDFLVADHTSGDPESTAILQEDAKKFADLLTEVLPVYYQAKSTSLV